MKHNWEYKRLGDVCKIVNGFAFKSELFKDSGMPILRIANIQNDTITTDALVFCNPSDYKTDLSKFLVKSDDLVMALSGATTGKIGINKTNIEFYLNQRVALFKDILISRRYLFYFLKTEGKNILESAFGVAQPNVSTSKLTELYIPVPPLNVQEQIVAELDKINETIEDCRELLCNLDALAQSLFYDFFGDPVTNPKGWETSRFGELCKLSAGGDKPFDTQKEISKDFNIPIYSNGIENEGLYGYTSKPRITSPAITISGRGTLGIPFIRLKPFVPIIRLIVAIPSPVVNLTFLFYMIKLLKIGGKGAAIPQLTVPMVKDLLLPVPPLELQEKFAARIEQIEEQKKFVEQTIAELQTLLDSRMDYWFN